MEDQLDHVFIQRITENLGIAHKVARIYSTDADDRGDVLQEMMYQLWRSYPAFNGRSKFSTWMYRVCLNTALTYRRNRNQRKQERISAAHHQIPDHAPETYDEEIALLLEAIRNLSPLNRAIVLLYLDNMSYEEIATIVGLSRSNVSVRLVRIRKELEKELRTKV